jgi:hypothetical protein
LCHGKWGLGLRNRLGHYVREARSLKGPILQSGADNSLGIFGHNVGVCQQTSAVPMSLVSHGAHLNGTTEPNKGAIVRHSEGIVKDDHVLKVIPIRHFVSNVEHLSSQPLVRIPGDKTSFCTLARLCFNQRVLKQGFFHTSVRQYFSF